MTAIQENSELREDSVSERLIGRKILIIVENLPVPFDRRVWLEATTLQQAGATVSVICPKAKGYSASYELLDGVHIYRHPMPPEGKGAAGYLVEYLCALFWETVLAWRVFFTRGFDTIQGCNPPDLIWMVALPFKLLGRKYIFDHHDINPELYEAKFGRRDGFWWLMRVLERISFLCADVVISTNDSYRAIAIERGRKRPEDVFVVRSGPNLAKMHRTEPNPALKKGREFLVAYVGVMGPQEGLDLLVHSVSNIVFDQHREDIQFILVGGGPSLDDLKSQAARLGIDPFVTFAGRVPDNLLFEALSTADVGVNPDRVNPMNDKSTMNKIMEYMAFSLPIVQFEVTEGRVSAQEASLYAKPNDTQDFASLVIRLLDNHFQRLNMGMLGRARVESTLSWGHQVVPLLAAYLRVDTK